MSFDFKDYLRELQRRHVVKAGLAYLVGAWLLVQVLDILLDAFQLGPGWMQTTIIALSVGFPIWLIIAWVYDFSPEGIKKTEDVPFDSKVAAKKNLQLDRLIIGGLAIAVILLIVNQVRLTTAAEQQPAMASIMPDFTSSIAVLAFEDISPDQDQDYFAVGLKEDIQTELIKYKDLKVISPSPPYDGKDAAIDIIGDSLGVAYAIRGSVRTAGPTFRITVKLIDTQEGSYIWSKTFDRNVEDILEVQREIARTVAENLNLTLLHEDVRERKVDPEAYKLYARAFKLFQFMADKPTAEADSLIRLSLKIDSTYSNSWALYSAITLFHGIYHRHMDPDEAASQGLEAARRAVTLDSANVFALTWLSNWQWHNRQGNESLKTLKTLLEEFPNNYDPHSYGAHSFTRMGMPESALEQAYIAYEIDPKSFDSPQFIGWGENYMENYARAIPYYEEFVERRVQITGTLEGAGLEDLALMYYKNGEKDKARETLEKVPVRFFRLATRTIMAYNDGNTREADSLLAEFKAIPEEEVVLAQDSDAANPDFELARIYIAKGDIDKAFEHLDLAYELLLTDTELLWYYPEFKKLHKDHRWRQLLDQLGDEFNFDYNVKE
ncbi:MAG: tetratricopeptide repeat protein [Robiginitalea sp.]